MRNFEICLSRKSNRTFFVRKCYGKSQLRFGIDMHASSIGKRNAILSASRHDNRMVLGFRFFGNGPIGYRPVPHLSRDGIVKGYRFLFLSGQCHLRTIIHDEYSLCCSGIDLLERKLRGVGGLFLIKPYRQHHKRDQNSSIIPHTTRKRRKHSRTDIAQKAMLGTLGIYRRVAIVLFHQIVATLQCAYKISPSRTLIDPTT